MAKKKWDKTFEERFEKHYDELKWLYAELYNNDMQAFEYFCNMLYDYYKARSKKLKLWDAGREVVNDWFAGNEMLGMLMYTNAFAGDLFGYSAGGCGFCC